MLAAYSRVILVSDEYKTEGGIRGMTGYIIEVYDDGHYEVEFSDGTGATIAQIVVNEDDVVLAPEPGVGNGN